jgi:hypothetical protein
MRLAGASASDLTKVRVGTEDAALLTRTRSWIVSANIRAQTSLPELSTLAHVSNHTILTCITATSCKPIACGTECPVGHDTLTHLALTTESEC